MILTIRTDKPEAEIGIFGPDGVQLEYQVWYAHRELADTLLGKINDLLASRQKDFTALKGIVVFQGPGSFTGLRIGITVANALAYGQDIPVVGATGDNWVQAGLQSLTEGANDRIVLPEYGAEANITVQKK